MTRVEINGKRDREYEIHLENLAVSDRIIAQERARLACLQDQE